MHFTGDSINATIHLSQLGDAYRTDRYSPPLHCLVVGLRSVTYTIHHVAALIVPCSQFLSLSLIYNKSPL